MRKWSQLRTRKYARPADGKLAVLREHNFRRFFIGQSASLLGDGMVGIALSFAVLDLTGSVTDLGIVFAARSVPMLAILLFGGVFADRFPRRSVMIAADLTRFAGQGFMAVLLISGHAQIWELAALQSVHGSATAVFNPACTGLIPSITRDDHLQQANALRGMATSAGIVAGPALSGILVAMTSPGWAIAVDAGSFGISAMMLARVRARARTPSPSQSFRRDLLDGWAEFRSRSWVWIMVVFSSLANLLFAVFTVLGAAVARDSLGGSTAWAAILGTYGAGAVVGGLAAMHVHAGRPLKAAVFASALFPLVTMGLAARLPVAAVIGLACCSGLGVSVFNALWDTTLQRGIPDKALSRVSAYEWFGAYACQPLGQAASGIIAGRLGIYSTLWLAAIVQVIITLATLTFPAIHQRDYSVADNIAESEPSLGAS